MWLCWRTPAWYFSYGLHYSLMPMCSWKLRVHTSVRPKLLHTVVCRLSALEAVIEDGQSLHVNLNPSINPNLLNHISLVFSKAASSLANMSHTVRLYGNGNSTSSTTAAAGLSYPPRQEQHQQGKGTQEGSPDANSSMKGGIASAVDAVCGRPADQHHCWQQFKMQLAGLMQDECEQHWADVMTAASDSPMIVPTLTGVGDVCRCSHMALKCVRSK